ncbi:site-specific DNA-methyltransferase [Candidatus Aquiluna sp. UB-MaderosW2red]|uniref:site-specific DNA-methyltransferase n=1 Tax=Candidatus Aquiluna sp. UB-MaderosW2red TaxID=1855377 RepID=UPI000875E3B1|nr:site-specific DNA-methyltransferase [Candidatus Aquiluna sp. UB-MaderosW2red]SCX03650.1 adenine-specific DNA-methyltransferase [Candidatus Aquiluna sp. UB-MaderosW2red]
MNEDIFETPSSTPNFQTELASQLAELVPEAIADGKIDLARLKELLSRDAADGSERFGLFWPGKQRALHLAQLPTTATLMPEPAQSVEWQNTKNVFIEGDNLEVVKILQKHYHGRIKLIYIDPPYNTGKDFVYPDNFSEGLDNYLDWTKQVDEEGKKTSSNTETEGRYHSNWLTMMYPRLKLARNLLAPDGVMCVSIDDHEVENLKRMMLEIFGEDNFLAQLIWDKQHSQQQGIFKRYHEYVLVFARSAQDLEGIAGGEGFIEAGALKKVSKANPASDFQFPAGVRFDAPDGFSLSGTFGDSEKVTVVEGALRALGGKTTEAVTLSAGWTQKNQMKSWFSGQETFDSKGQKVVEFYFNSAGKLKCKKERGVVTPPTILPRYGMVSEQTTKLDKLMGGHYFDTPKPIAMISDLINWFTVPGDLVLDFFAGSGTSGHAVFDVSRQNGSSRNFILVQLPEPLDESSETGRQGLAAGFTNIAQLTRKRLERAGAQLGSELASAGSDFGFRSYRLVGSNFSKWQASTEFDRTTLEQHLFSLRGSAEDNANYDALLIEVLLKQGYSLSEVFETVSISGLELRSIGNGIVLAYLNEHVRPSLIELREVLRTEPLKFIILEDAFQGDDELKTNLTQLCKSSSIELWTV